VDAEGGPCLCKIATLVKSEKPTNLNRLTQAAQAQCNAGFKIMDLALEYRQHPGKHAQLFCRLRGPEPYPWVRFATSPSIDAARQFIHERNRSDKTFEFALGQDKSAPKRPWFPKRPSYKELPYVYDLHVLAEGVGSAVWDSYRLQGVVVSVMASRRLAAAKDKENLQNLDE
jgi:hypothetical protein